MLFKCESHTSILKNQVCSTGLARCVFAMFCPECRAEYRPGFTRCCDCDVNLVRELSPSVDHPRIVKRDSADWFFPFPGWSLYRLYRDSSKTLHWWASYKRQSGSWPWSLIALEFLSWTGVLVGMGFLIWWAGEHHLSRWQLLAVLLLLLLPLGVLYDWARRAVKLSLQRNRKHLTKLKR